MDIDRDYTLASRDSALGLEPQTARRDTMHLHDHAGSYRFCPVCGDRLDSKLL